MFTFKSLFAAKDPSLCSENTQHISQSVSLRNSKTPSSVDCEQSKILFINYEPTTNVKDYSRIDLDQKEIEKELEKKRFQSALNIYVEGAYSGAYASLTLLSSGLPGVVKKETPAKAISVAGNELRGKLYQTATITSTSIQVQYETSEGCSNVRSSDNLPNDLSGCFSATGNIGFGIYSNIIWDVTYHYDATEDTQYSRSLQRLSTTIDSNTRYLEHNYYKIFLDYYGQHDYADQWIIAAFNSKSTNFVNGNANFGSYSEIGRVEAITKSTKYMGVWMNVIDVMEDAIYDCNNRCGILGCGSNQGSLSWDKAVALYVGSQEDGGDDGYMLYKLANEECQNFDTCDSYEPIITDQAKVNIEIMDQFIHGQKNLSIGKCYNAKKNKERIAKSMTVPLVQGTLRRAYNLYSFDESADSAAILETNRAEGAVFAASVLPMIHACNDADARIIHENMKASTEEGQITSYIEVKTALENNYQCLGITCEDVGELLDAKTKSQHWFDAHPCNIGGDGNYMSQTDYSFSISGTNNDRGTIFSDEGVTALVCSLVFFVTAFIMCIVLMCKSTSLPEDVTSSHHKSIKKDSNCAANELSGIGNSFKTLDTSENQYDDRSGSEI